MNQIFDSYQALAYGRSSILGNFLRGSRTRDLNRVGLTFLPYESFKRRRIERRQFQLIALFRPRFRVNAENSPVLKRSMVWAWLKGIRASDWHTHMEAMTMLDNKLIEELNEAKGLDEAKRLLKDRPGIALPYYYQL